MKLEIALVVLPGCDVKAVATAGEGAEQIVAQGETIVEALHRLHKTVVTKVWLDQQAESEARRQRAREQEFDAIADAILTEREAVKLAYLADPTGHYFRDLKQRADEETDAESLAVRNAARSSGKPDTRPIPTPYPAPCDWDAEVDEAIRRANA